MVTLVMIGVDAAVRQRGEHDCLRAELTVLVGLVLVQVADRQMALRPRFGRPIHPNLVVEVLVNRNSDAHHLYLLGRYLLSRCEERYNEQQTTKEWRTMRVIRASSVTDSARLLLQSST